MKMLPWMGLGALALATAATTVACGSDDKSSSTGGTGGTVVSTGGTSGSGGTGGGTGGTSTGGTSSGGTGGGTATALGKGCTADAECGTGLICVLPAGTQLDGEGPAKGLCTADCTADASVCAGIDPNSLCLNYGTAAYCVEGCDFGPATATFSPTKCHGRHEMACSALIGSTDGAGACTVDTDCPAGPNGEEPYCNDGTCANIIPACIPMCNKDSDCGTGLHCNPKTGLCNPTAPSGLDTGSVCVQPADGGTDPCKGICYQFGDGADADYMCSNPCTAYETRSCGWEGTGDADAWCLYGSSYTQGAGDQGVCAQLCDCDDDCRNPNLICDPLPSQLSALGRAGACVGKTDADGGALPGIPCSGTGGTGGTSGTGGTAGSGSGGTAGTGTGGTAGSGTGGTAGSGTGGTAGSAAGSAGNAGSN